MTKKILTLLMALCLTLTALPLSLVAAPTSVEDAKDQITASQQKQDQLQEQLNAIKGEKETYLEQKEILEQQVGELQSEINAYDRLIRELDGQIATMEQQISDAETSYADNIDKYKAQARATYEQGQVSYLDVLLGAESFSDFLLRLDYVKQVALYEKDLLNTITKSIQTIKRNKVEVENKRTEQVTARNTVATRKDELDDKEDAVQSVINKIQSNQKYLQNLLQKEAENEEKLNQWIEDELAGRNDSDVEYEGGDWLWPVARGNSYHYISSGYGWRTLNGKKSFHYAIDIAVPKNTPIYASKSGEVFFSGWGTGGAGWSVKIDHGDGYCTYYFHMNSRPIVSNGQKVKKGQVIGYVGMSGGTSTGYHLDIRFYINGKADNPLNYLKKPSWLTR